MKNRYFGIDLGTTYSVISYVDDSGEPQTLLSAEGGKTVPSVVYYEAGGNIVVGEDAKANRCMEPGRVVCLVKNEMGHTNADGSPRLVNTDEGDFLPEIVSAEILKKMVRDANAALNLNPPVMDVVVTVPQNFGDSAKKATMNAIGEAGLNPVAPLVSEPTAAALYYSTKHRVTNSNFLIYDMGGGTFDITLAHVDGVNVEVLATGGNNRLGGGFFDHDVVELIADYVQKEYGIDLHDASYVDSLQSIYLKVEEAKKKLSSSVSTVIRERLGGGVNLNFELTREMFNEVVSPYYYKTENLIKSVLKKADMELSAVDEILLVGGSSRIPFVVDSLTEFFGKAPSRELNPDEVVSWGAALYAKQYLAGEASKIIDVCSHGIGILAKDKADGPEYNDILIKANTKVPAIAEKKYQLPAGASDIYVEVYEGDFKDIEDVTRLCGTNVPLPCELQGDTRVHIRLELDRSQLLHIYVLIPSMDNISCEVLLNRWDSENGTRISPWKKQIIEGFEGSATELSKAATKDTEEENGKKKGFFNMPFFRKGKESSEGKEVDPEEELRASVKREEEKRKEEEKKKKDKSKAIPKAVEAVFSEVVGMQEVKETLRDYENRIKAGEKLNATHYEEKHAFAILGKPGIGTTTAAIYMAKGIYKLGRCSLENPIIANYDSLVTGDEDECKNNINAVFQSAMNGVLIIDNFHEFYTENDNTPERIAVDLIRKAYLVAGKVTLIVAGYCNELQSLFDKEPEFDRLFLQDYRVQLIGYTPDEMLQIMRLQAKDMGNVIDPEADAMIKRKIKGESKLPDFDYIHFLVEKLLEPARTDAFNKAQAKRHAKDDDFSILRLENFQIGELEQTLEELLEELDKQIGLDEVKTEVKAQIANLQSQLEREKIDPKSFSAPNRHLLFVGPPGTGKTTIAELVAKIYKAIGILDKGQLVRVVRADLVSPYQSQSGPQTHAKCAEAYGGILFVDEAHQLVLSDNDDSGLEALKALVTELEDHRGDFVVIFAGYEKEMDDLLRRDPGLPDRFPNKIHFSNYNIDELMQIFDLFREKAHFQVEGAALPVIRDQLQGLMVLPNFANGRVCRSLFERFQKEQALRIQALVDKGERVDNEERFIIRKADVEAGVPKRLSREEMFAELDAMTGLSKVKEKVHEVADAIEANLLRRKAGLSDASKGAMHLVFTGNPGTGKTTVARLIANIYYSLGALPTNRFVECERKDLVAGYVGQTALNTQKIIDKAMGGVLFIDEAYTLVKKDSPGDFGQEAIDTIMKAMEDYRDNLLVIVAGYTKEMQEFLDSNPGIRSRFPNDIYFSDYTEEEKLDIFRGMCAKDGYSLEDGIPSLMLDIFESVRGDETYVNGRGVRTIYEKSVTKQGGRIVREQREHPELAVHQEAYQSFIRLLKKEDIFTPVELKKKTGIEDIYAELDELTGLAEVKENVREIADYMELQRLQNKKGSVGSMHMVFSGNPGTGKTTVARIVGKIYHAIGALPTDKCVECQRSDLVGGYVGHTAIKTREVVQKALGGVLFIDEAYTLAKGDSGNDFGQEAIDELLKMMEDHRDNLLVIIAGYTEQMEMFLNTNPGLQSRFNKRIHFADYSLEEKLEIFRGICKGEDYLCAEGVENRLLELLESVKDDPQYVNGRGVRNIFEAMRMKLATRVTKACRSNPELANDSEFLFTFTPEDVSL